MNEEMNGYTHEQLVARIHAFDKQVEELSGTIEMLGEDIRKKQTIISNVTSTLQTAWEDGELADDLVEDLQSWLYIETQIETQVTVTATWNITVRHPKGFDVEDNLSVDVTLEVDGDKCDIDNDPYPEVEVSAN